MNKKLGLSLLVLSVLCIEHAQSLQNINLPRWVSLYSRDFLVHHRQYMENLWNWAPENGSIEWSESEPLLHHLLELDARDAWSGVMKNEQSLSEISSVFGRSQLTKIELQGKNIHCLARLYDNSKKLSEDQVCTSEYYYIMEQFVSCWSSWIRTTTMGQYLIWRMLKTIAHCYGRNGKIDMKRLAALRQSIQSHDADDTELLERLTMDDMSYENIEKTNQVMVKRQADNLKEIFGKINAADAKISKIESKKIKNRIKNLIIAQKLRKERYLKSPFESA